MTAFDELVHVGPMVWWIGRLFKLCDGFDNDLLAAGFIVITLPISLALLMLQFAWWTLLLVFAALAFPFLLLWRITHGR